MNLPGWNAALDPLFRWSWTTSLEASLLVLLVLAVHRVFGRWLSAQTRYALTLLVLARLVLPTAPASPSSLLNLMPRSRSEPSLAAALPVPEIPATAQAPSKTEEHGARSGAARREQRAASPGRAFGGSRVEPVLILSWLWFAGVGISLGSVLWRQRQFSRWLRRQSASADPRLLDLLHACRMAMGIARPVRLTVASHGQAPALFGWRRPNVLIPESALDALSEGELRLVLLHELGHVRRHDVLLNWIVIVLQAWHWFNPLIWLAMRRLRDERELVCDALVLSRLSRPDQRLYGETLIKLLENFGQRPVPAGLLPVIRHKHDLKKRITMISTFKPPHPATRWATGGIALVLCFLTFTRAADPKAESASPERPGNTAASGIAGTPAPFRAGGIEVLEERLDQQRQRVAAAQETVEKLRRELGMVGVETDLTNGGTLDQETVRLMERERISAEARAAQYEALRRELAARSTAELRQMLPTAMPDSLLIGLLERLSIAETELARLSTEFGPDQPQVKSVRSGIKNLDQQIESRIAGILEGLKAQIASARAQASSLKDQIGAARMRDAELTERYRPYFEAKRELETQRHVAEVLMLRLMQERIDADLGRAQKKELSR